MIIVSGTYLQHIYINSDAGGLTITLLYVRSNTAPDQPSLLHKLGTSANYRERNTITTSQSDWDTYICQDLWVPTTNKMQNAVPSFLSVSFGRRWYSQREKPPTFSILTLPLALHCQPHRFAISVGIWRKSPDKSAGAGEKASVDERSEAVDKIFMSYVVQLPQYPFPHSCSR